MGGTVPYICETAAIGEIRYGESNLLRGPELPEIVPSCTLGE
jgi:hypothetical protein